MKWEKKARLAMIHVVTKDVALEMLKLCHEAKDWTSYNSTLVHISKRRQQHSSVIKACVEVAVSLVDKTPDRQTKLTFVKTLRDVTEGKIFLEVQRARLTRRLASMKEEDSELDEASSIMQEVQVETFGTMENAEKVEFILEQIRLCLTQKDWVRRVLARSARISITLLFFCHKTITQMSLIYITRRSLEYLHSNVHSIITKYLTRVSRSNTGTSCNYSKENRSQSDRCGRFAATQTPFLRHDLSSQCSER